MEGEGVLRAWVEPSAACLDLGFTLRAPPPPSQGDDKSVMAGWTRAVARPGLPQVRTCTH